MSCERAFIRRYCNYNLRAAPRTVRVSNECYWLRYYRPPRNRRPLHQTSGKTSAAKILISMLTKQPLRATDDGYVTFRMHLLFHEFEDSYTSRRGVRANSCNSDEAMNSGGC